MPETTWQKYCRICLGITVPPPQKRQPQEPFRYRDTANFPLASERIGWESILKHARDEEAEACAAICEGLRPALKNDFTDDDADRGRDDALTEAAEAIRLRVRTLRG